MGQLVERVRGTARRFIGRAVWGRIDDPDWRSTAGYVMATVGVLVFAVRVLGAVWPGHYRIFFPDSFSFLKVAKQTPLSPGFYVAERPIGFPTLLFLMGRSVQLTVVTQTLLYGAVYIAAVVTAAHVLVNREVRFVCGFLVLTIAIEPRFALWNTHILSESIGMTTAVASVALWWRFAAKPTTRRLHVAGIATIAWLVCRDSNVPPWMAVGVPTLLLASWLWKSQDGRLRRALRIWGAVTLAVCIFVGVSQAVNGRDRYATINNVGERVLPDAEMTRWFAARGMPLDSALIARTGQNSFTNDWDMLTSKDLQTFRDWADGTGQRWMLVSYVWFMPKYLNLLDADMPTILSYRDVDYDAFGVTGRLPDPPPAQIGGPTNGGGLLVWTLLGFGGVVLAFVRRRRVEAVVLGLLLVSTFVDLYMAYVGDSVEVLRHMVGPLARMALVMVFCLALGLDTGITLLRERRQRGIGQRAEPKDELAEPALVEAGQ